MPMTCGSGRQNRLPTSLGGGGAALDAPPASPPPPSPPPSSTANPVPPVPSATTAAFVAPAADGGVKTQRPLVAAVAASMATRQGLTLVHIRSQLEQLHDMLRS